MTSALTVWTSSTTREAESLVARMVRQTGDLASAYDSISITGCNEPEIKEKLESSFKQLVKLTMADSTMHIMAVTPLYDQGANERLSLLIKACERLDHSVTLHIVGLCSSLVKIFDADEASDAESNQGKEIAYLKHIAAEVNFPVSYSLIEDYIANGAPVKFTLRSLSKYIALIQTALLTDYYAVLSPVMVSSHAGDNLSIGLSSLSFNRDIAVSQLLGLGFLAALENVGINKQEVDLQKATNEAEKLLAGIQSHFPNLYEKKIRPLIKEKGKTDRQVAGEAAGIIEEDIEELKRSILSLLDDESLTFPEKEAVLAMILGRDNENLRGSQYEHEGLLLDDACSETINLYVDSFNLYCDDKKLLPVRNDYEALRLVGEDESNESEEKAVIPENFESLNPLSEIKKLKQDILNTTSYIRERQDELKGLQQTQRAREAIDEVTRKWKKPRGVLKDVEYEEKPLEEKYTPSTHAVRHETVDLRKYFTPVRNQQKLGACTSFAVVSMYEAMMNRNGAEGENVMSPGYLYYYSNIVNGRPGGGSNFFEQIEILEKRGVCYEDLYGYEPEQRMDKPGEEAEKDAETHKVIKAQQIPLVNFYNKVDAIKHNHELMTCALSEGYPVGISLKIYENFGSDGAFILHPDDTPDAKEEGWHAMVLVGYSEENKFYIVRNSWGKDFGEDGYCYVPAVYIDDPDYMNFACIITEITDGGEKKAGDVPSVLANFGATELEIRIASIRNAIADERVVLKNFQKLYAEYYRYYQDLMAKLTLPRVQNAIRSDSETARYKELMDAEAEKHRLENSFVGRLKEYKLYLRNTILILLGIAVGLFSVWYFARSATVGILALVAAGLGVLVWLGYKWWVRIKRRELQEELDAVAVRAAKQKEQFMEMQLKYHVAGIWLNKFYKLLQELGLVFDRLVSFNETLREWQKEYSARVGETDEAEGQMFRYIDASPRLNSFFAVNKKDIVRRIDLIRTFDDYKANLNDLEKSHEVLRQTVRRAVNSMMSDFNLANYLLGDTYTYLEGITAEEEVSALVAVGQPTYRNQALHANPAVRILILNLSGDRLKEWESQIMPLFPPRPNLVASNDPTSIIILTIQPIHED